ncbi:MAG: hypothetical protein WKF84_13760 [Pyrinomonadaceae bacterium]
MPLQTIDSAGAEIKLSDDIFYAPFPQASIASDAQDQSDAPSPLGTFGIAYTSFPVRMRQSGRLVATRRFPHKSLLIYANLSAARVARWTSLS